MKLLEGKTAFITGAATGLSEPMEQRLVLAFWHTAACFCCSRRMR